MPVAPLRCLVYAASLVLVSVAPAFGAAQNAKAPPSSMGSGGAKGTGKVEVGTSYYFYYVPSSYNPGVPWPLVIHFHGAGSSPDDMGSVAGEYRKWSEAADKYHFIWIGLKSSTNQGWPEADDANIPLALKDAKSKWNVLLKQVYASGFSAGGTVCTRFATGPASAEIAAMCAFCLPYVPGEYKGGKPLKAPAYFASNSGDFNFKKVQDAAKDFEKRGHKSKFVDESERLHAHRFDAKTALAAYEWIMQYALP